MISTEGLQYAVLENQRRTKSLSNFLDGNFQHELFPFFFAR